MTQLALAASNPTLAPMPPHQWAHDVRNLLATIGLHLERLEKLSGPAGSKAASAALALISRGATLCTGALAESGGPRPLGRRRGFDLTGTIKEVVAVLAPTAPEGFDFVVEAGGPVIVLGDQTEVFRILFNLAQNAVSAARGGAGLDTLTFSVGCGTAGVSTRIADNGPGLPKAVRTSLFRAPENRAHGFGLAIARELAERNGGRLSYIAGAGATFVLELPHAAGRGVSYGAAMPSLGRRHAS
jgi:signal transduction histidine kinase